MYLLLLQVYVKQKKTDLQLLNTLTHVAQIIYSDISTNICFTFSSILRIITKELVYAMFQTIQLIAIYKKVDMHQVLLKLY